MFIGLPLPSYAAGSDFFGARARLPIKRSAKPMAAPAAPPTMAGKALLERKSSHAICASCCLDIEGCAILVSQIMNKCVFEDAHGGGCLRGCRSDFDWHI